MTYTYTWPEDRKARIRKVQSWELEDRPAWCAGKPGRTYFSHDGCHFRTFEQALGYVVGYCHVPVPAECCERPLGHLGDHSDGVGLTWADEP